MKSSVPHIVKQTSEQGGQGMRTEYVFWLSIAAVALIGAAVALVLG